VEDTIGDYSTISVLNRQDLPFLFLNNETRTVKVKTELLKPTDVGTHTMIIMLKDNRGGATTYSLNLHVKSAEDSFKIFEPSIKGRDPYEGR